jgi:large subunit ribosomal protein L9
MRIILKETILNLGTVGDQVEVNPGYARNFLIPQGKAMALNASNLESFEAMRKELEALEREKLAEAKARAEKLEKVDLVFSSKVKDADQIYGSITVNELVDLYAKHGHEVEKSELKIINGPVKALGEYDFILQIHADVSMPLKFKVVSDQPVEAVTESNESKSSDQVDQNDAA